MLMSRTLGVSDRPFTIPLTPAISEEPEKDILGDLADSLDGIVETFGESIGSGISKNENKFKIDFDVNDLIVPIVSGVIVFYIIKNL